MEAGNSLRASLIRRLMLPLIVVVIVAAAADYYLTVLPGLQAQDQELKKLSSLIAEFAAGTRDPRSISTYAERLFKPDSKVRTYYQVVDQDGHVITGSSLLAPVSAEFPLDEPKVFNSHVGDAPVRVAALKGKDLTVQVAETMGRREELVQHMLLSVVLPDFVLGALIVLIVKYGIVNGLTPLIALRKEIESRSPGDLRPVEAAGPSEVQPLVHALNDLLARLRAASELQRRFFASAAHQLRTPLAALTTQAELAYRHVNENDLPNILDTLRQDADRTAHLAEQLIMLARTDPHAQVAERMRPLDLKQVVEEAAKAWVPRALRKEIDIGFDVESAPIVGDPLLIQELLANLLDNAIAYTAPGGQLTVNTKVCGDEAILTVQDNGIGIPESAREKVFERFFRVPGTTRPGSGLGLAIVKEIVIAHGGRVTIEAPESRGTIVKVALPLATKFNVGALQAQ